MKMLVPTLIALAAIVIRAADTGPIVTVTGGQIRGAALERGGAVFKGIPYAQPPVGALRWREPMPVKPWVGVRDATVFGAPCTQTPAFFAPGLAAASSEDCLSLNVWASQWPPPRAKQAVMVWIHGGGNYAGAASEPVYDGERLARRGVILVSLNYRLNSFGFFAHPALSRESGRNASGNQALLDQIAALRWVRRNIATFGGDPDNVTIFGQSAGSLNVSVLMTSPLTRGLFRRVIAESLAVASLAIGLPEPLHAAENRGVAFASKLGTAAASLEDLRGVPAQKILEAASPVPDPNDRRSLEIILDGYVLRDLPERVFATGRQHRVSLLLGSNAREQAPGDTSPQDLRTAIERAYGPLASRALDLYFAAVAAVSDPVYGSPVEQWLTDRSFRCPAVAQAAWHAAAGNPTFQYEFARVAQGREKLGATHGAELSHVFGTLDRGVAAIGPRAQATPIDWQISEVVQQYWTNFARTGDPNSGQLPAWPKFDVSSRPYVQFTDAGPVARAGLRRPVCDLYIENARRLMTR